MVGMAVGQEYMADALSRGLLVGDESRIAGEERIDQDGLAVKVEAERGVAGTGDVRGKYPLG